MKTIILLLSILGFSNLAFCEVRPEYSGSWYNPAQSGHGFSIEVLDENRSIAFWYVYNPFGAPIFLYADAINVGNSIQAQVYMIEEMVWGEFDPDTKVIFDWGTLTITFHDCSHATLEYDSILEYPSGEVFGSGQMPLERLASMDGFHCSDYPAAGVYGGFAHSDTDDATYSGYGIVSESGELDFFSEDGVLVMGQLNVGTGTSGGMTASGFSVFFEQGSPVVSGTLSASGNFNPDMIGADFSAPGTGETGYFQVFKLSRQTNRAVLMTDLSGDWTAYNYMSRQSTPVTINTDGTFSLTDQLGCIFNGRISIPNSELNILEATATVTGCAQTSGTITGNGAYLENENIEFNGQDVIFFAGWNGADDGAVLRLTRN